MCGVWGVVSEALPSDTHTANSEGDTVCELLSVCELLRGAPRQENWQPGVLPPVAAGYPGPSFHLLDLVPAQGKLLPSCSPHGHSGHT